MGEEMIWSALRRKKFNCGDQSSLTWMQRAQVCADVLEAMTQGLPMPVHVADIGCGDQKLRVVFEERSLPVRYDGFDLHPQSREVREFDIRSDRLDGRPDVIVVLGVLEYLNDPVATLRRLAETSPRLIFSYVAKRPGEYSSDEARKLNWIDRLTEQELLDCLPSAGWSIHSSQITPDARTFVVGCIASTQLRTP